ncbi:MAG: AI-2E family transporter, partial [Lacipirellulaceae bacterium]
MATETRNPDQSGALSTGPTSTPPLELRADQIENDDAQACDLAEEIVAWDLKEVSLMVLTVLACFYTLYFTRALLFPIVLAFILNLVLKPIVLRLRKWHVPTTVSAALVMLLLTGILAGGIGMLWNPASRWVAEAQLRLPAAAQKLKDLQKPIEQIAEVSKQVEEITEVEGRS